MAIFRFAPFIAILALAACDSGDQGGSQGFGPAPVTVATPVKQIVQEWDEYTGRFGAVDFVEIRARVSGYLDSINFEDGEVVQQGDLLFVIDPRPFEIALEQAQAELVSAESRLDLAQKDLERARPLLERNNISQQVFDERLQGRNEAQASLTSARAAVRNAELNLEFTQVTAPITGRVSRDQVSVGNLVSGGGSGATLLTTIVSLDPIHFYFDADEAAYLRYIRQDRAGERISSRDQANVVQLRIGDEEGWPHEGVIDFVDNVVDFETGTIRARAIFENEDFIFTPGIFARIRLIGRPPYQAVLVPDEAVSNDLSRNFVLVVGEENVVEARTVTLGPLFGTYRAIREGLDGSEQVIINGLMRARPGAPVIPQPVELDPQPVDRG